MGIFSFLKELITVDDSIMDDVFSLGEREVESQDRGGQEERSLFRLGRQKKVPLKKPLRASAIRGEQFQQHLYATNADQWRVSPNIDDNIMMIKTVFHLPENADIITREFQIALKPPVRACAVFTEGAASSAMIDQFVLQPLMLLSNLEGLSSFSSSVDLVKARLLPGNQLEEKHSFKDAVEGVLAGTTAVFIDGYPAVLLVETKGWPTRSVSPPRTENVVRGPQESFVEHLRTNTALVRKRLKNDALVIKMVKVGRFTKSDCAIMYLDGVVNPKLVREVNRRISAVKVNFVSDSGTLQQLIEDNPYAIIPGVLSTERPDRVAAFISEGHVAILLDGDPFALIIPVTFWGLLQSAEDYYIYWPFAIMLRWIRLIAFGAALLTPAFYVAVTNFHPEMIPTDLLYAIAAAREKVPFPVIFEVLIMEISFELIREAGVRIPNVIGPTIGIVGALILGQAAVAASIVSPILVIVVAITGLGSFAIPNYTLSFSLRLLRFAFILMASWLGFFGIAVGVFLFAVQVCGQKSFGVPIMSPVAPFRPASGDVVTRFPIHLMNQMPHYLRPLQTEREEPITRGWMPANDSSERKIISAGQPGRNNKRKGEK